jgi:hypothetical protein
VPGVVPVLAVVVVVVAVAVGGNLFGLRDDIFGGGASARRPAAGRDVTPGSTPSTVAGNTTLRSQPWWQKVQAVDGRGSMQAAAFTISDDAIQWRADWSCDSGHLTVRIPDRPKPLVDAACPGPGMGYATKTGVQNLAVTADGPWHMQVEQQVDVPLVEPPLPAMTEAGAAPVASGSVYRIDQNGSGKVTVYRLADGSHALRLEDFFVSPNVDLELRFSTLEAPHSTSEYTAAPNVKVAPLDITAGSMNFTVPPDVDPSKYRSLVVWCPLVTSAYAAATLG